MPKVIHQEFRRAVGRYWREGVRSPKKIEECLDGDPDLADLWEHEEAPSRRWIERQVERLRKVDTSGPWSLELATDPSAAFVLQVVGEVASQTRLDRITVAEAAWVTRLRYAAPDIPPWPAFRLAQEYIAREGRAPTSDLDLMVYACQKNDAFDGLIEMVDEEGVVVFDSEDPSTEKQEGMNSNG